MPRDYATTSHNASHWWRRGATGRGVRVAIFDTGLNAAHSFVGNVVEVRCAPKERCGVIVDVDREHLEGAVVPVGRTEDR